MIELLPSDIRNQANVTSKETMPVSEEQGISIPNTAKAVLESLQDDYGLSLQEITANIGIPYDEIDGLEQGKEVSAETDLALIRLYCRCHLAR